jgi:hypothetical protein
MPARPGGMALPPACFPLLPCVEETFGLRTGLAAHLPLPTAPSENQVIRPQPFYPGLLLGLHPQGCTTSARNGRVSEPARHGRHETPHEGLGTHTDPRQCKNYHWNFGRAHRLLRERVKCPEVEAIVGISTPLWPLPMSQPSTPVSPLGRSS